MGLHSLGSPYWAHAQSQHLHLWQRAALGLMTFTWPTSTQKTGSAWELVPPNPCPDTDGCGHKYGPVPPPVASSEGCILHCFSELPHGTHPWEEGGKVWHLFDRFALQAFSNAESPRHPLPPAITTNSFIIRKSESSFALSQVCYTIGWMELQIRFFLCRTQWSSLGHMGHGHCLGVYSTMFSLNNWANPSKEMRKYKANKLEILRREG